MRIFYSTVEVYPPRRVDIVELFMKQLANRGIETTWVMRRKHPGPCKKERYENQFISLPFYIKGGKIAQIFNKLTYWTCDLLALAGCGHSRFDIIQVRDKYIAAIFGLVIAQLFGMQFVFWLSYPFPEHDREAAKLEIFPRNLIYLVRSALGYVVLYQFIMRFSDHCFVQSEQMKRDIMAHGISAEKMTAVPMGVANEMLNKYDPDVTIEPGTVVYLGTLVRVRRLETLVHAMGQVIKLVPNARLLFVGDGDVPEDRTFLESEVKRLGLENVVEFTGFLPMQEAWKIVETAAVCVSPFYPTPILRSTSPTKIIEYMALGKPVVANDHPEQSQIIAESGAGLCVEWSEQAFAKAIIQLLTNPEQAAEMGQRGPEWVRQHRTYDQIADQVYARYQAILLRKPK